MPTCAAASKQASAVLSALGQAFACWLHFAMLVAKLSLQPSHGR
jgi:hypothetical protein